MVNLFMEEIKHDKKCLRAVMAPDEGHILGERKWLRNHDPMQHRTLDHKIKSLAQLLALTPVDKFGGDS